jgi:FkbM family methyltransferase
MKKEEIYNILDKEYFSEHMHEKHVIDHLPELIKHTNVFVDIGASLGQYTYFMNKLMNQGEIIAVEPDPVRYERLKQNSDNWSKSSENAITCIEGVVSDTNKELPFFTTNSNLSGGLFKHDLPKMHSNVKSSVAWSEIKVRSYTLDSLCADKVPDLVKVDVEGSELRVLLGAKNLIKQGNVLFLMELHNWNDPQGQKSADDIFDFFIQYGYKHINFYGKSLFAKHFLKRYPLLWSKIFIYSIISFIKKRLR